MQRLKDLWATGDANRRGLILFVALCIALALPLCPLAVCSALMRAIRGPAPPTVAWPKVTMPALAEGPNEVPCPTRALSPTSSLTPTETETPTPVPATATLALSATLTLSPTATDTPVPTPTATPLPTPTRQEVQVVEVVDGDTIKVSIDGQVCTVRYIGVDTPEAVEWMGPEARAANKELVEGKTVSLEKDISETDKYGRLLRYVWVGDLMVNAELVRLGYAQVSTYPPDVKYQDLFLKLQQEAREAQRGLWGPQPTVAVAPTSAPVGGTCPYIGNSNTRKFHRAGCSSVGQMSPEHKVCFTTRDEAIAQGFVPCKRCNP